MFENIGYCISSGMGLSAITWQELQCFINLSGYNISSSECEILINMSKTYCSYLETAKEPNCAAPFNIAAQDDDALAQNRKLVEQKLKGLRGRNRN